MQVSRNDLHPALQRVQQLVEQLGWSAEVEDDGELCVFVPVDTGDEPAEEAIYAYVQFESGDLTLVEFATEQLPVPEDTEDAGSLAFMLLTENMDNVYGHWAIDKDDEGEHLGLYHRLNVAHITTQELQLMLQSMADTVYDFVQEFSDDE